MGSSGTIRVHSLAKEQQLDSVTMDLSFSYLLRLERVDGCSKKREPKDQNHRLEQ
jgi:hypothetical protein